MVIGYCGKVPRNTGIDPDAIAQIWRDRVHLEAHGSAAAEARRLAAGCSPRFSNGRPSWAEVGAALDRVDWPLQALRMPRNSPSPLRRMRRRT